MTNSGKERREHKRVSIVLPIISKHENVEIEMKTANISLGGAYCHIDRYIPEMTKLALRLRFDDFDKQDTQWFDTEAVVVRIEPNRRGAEDYHVAMFFTNLSQDAEKKLKELLS